MPFVKGKSGNEAGRPQGAVNIINRTIREVFIDVFNQAQNDPAMASVSLKNFIKKYPRDFYQIAARIIPTEIRAEIRTPEGIQITFIKDADSPPIGTDPESNFSLPGESSGL
jgi:hypothetical protein